MPQQTTTELTDANGLKQAYEAGTAWAANLKVGDTFLGCKPEADKLYTDKLQRNVFMTAALDGLRYVKVHTRVVTTGLTAENVITKVERL